MTLTEALDIVLELAEQNVIDGGEETAREEKRQRRAIRLVRRLLELLQI